MIKFPRTLFYILKIIGIYEFLKKIYLKYFKFLKILKDDIETHLFSNFLNLKKNNIFIDVGANKGSIIDKVLLIKKNTKILAFEPFYKYFLFLKKKYKKNFQISLFNKAIDKNISSKYFYYNNKKIDEESFSLIRHDRFNKKIKVCTSKLDQELKNMNIDIVKIDVEGSEYNVLQGSKNTIKKNKPVLFIEATHKTIFNVNLFLLKNNYLLFIYEYNIFKKSLFNNWLKGNVITNNKFEKKIYTVSSLKKIKNSFMVNLIGIHKSRINDLKNIIIIDKKISTIVN